jgi:ribosomal protein L31
VFNDSDPGAAHPSMTPSLVLLRTVETKVRMGSSAITRIAITTFTFDCLSRSHAAFAGWQPCYVRDVLLRSHSRSSARAVLRLVKTCHWTRCVFS